MWFVVLLRVKELGRPDLIEADQNTLVGRVCGGVSDRETRVFLIFSEPYYRQLVLYIQSV